MTCVNVYKHSSTKVDNKKIIIKTRVVSLYEHFFLRMIDLFIQKRRQYNKPYITLPFKLGLLIVDGVRHESGKTIACMTTQV